MGNIHPWGATAIHQRYIDQNERNRMRRFEKVRSQLRLSNEDLSVQETRQKILDLDLINLIEALQTSKITAVDALDAYVWKAFEVHEKLNCATEFLIDAFDEAGKLDKEYAGQQKPPLFGVPFSVKGNFYLKGYDCCLGLAKYLNAPATEDCTFVSHLRSLGAVPFVYTNIPQGLLSFVCSNSVYGTTGNPYNTDRTPGGSSGGEAALCAAGGSAFGIGSDLAGSLRIPAAFCGLVTLKPTEARFVVKGAYSGLPGRGRLALSYGYFTKTVQEQLVLLQHTFGSDAYCSVVPKTIPVPLNFDRMKAFKGNRRLRIGYYTDDGFLAPVPACTRVVLETVDKLEDLGHQMVKFKVPKPELAASLFFKNIMPDQGALVNCLYDHEPLSPYIKMFAWLLKVPICVRWFVGFLLQWISPQMASVCHSYVKDLPDLRHTQQLTDEYTQEFTKQWQELKLDALVCPAFTVPAMAHSYPSRMSFCAVTTGFYNMIDFPSGIVPTGYVTANDDAKLVDEEVWTTGYNLALKTLRAAAKDSVNMPLAVQLVTLPFHEEECLSVMEMVEDLWRN